MKILTSCLLISLLLMFPIIAQEPIVPEGVPPENEEPGILIPEGEEPPIPLPPLGEEPNETAPENEEPTGTVPENEEPTGTVPEIEEPTGTVPEIEEPPTMLPTPPAPNVNVKTPPVNAKVPPAPNVNVKTPPVNAKAPTAPPVNVKTPTVNAKVPPATNVKVPTAPNVNVKAPPATNAKAPPATNVKVPKNKNVPPPPAIEEAPQDIEIVPLLPTTENIESASDIANKPSSTGLATEALYVLAQPTTHITPFGGLRTTWITGELGFDSPFGGRRGTKLDLQDDLFVEEQQWGDYFGIDAQHSYFRISIAYGFNQSDSRGNIPREVLVADSYLQSGARVETNIDIHWFSGSFGYTVLARNWGGLGVKLSFNYVDIRTSTDVDGYLADDPTNPLVQITLDNSLFIPMPMVGGYLDWAPNDRWLMRTELDFIFYNIVNRKLMALDFNFESRYYFSATQKFYGYFRFQYEYFAYEFNTSKFRGNYDWHSFLFLIGAGINF